MIAFLLKGLIRDRNRSLFPAIVVMLGVALTVLLNCWITGILGDFIEFSAKFSTGHVKITTRAYSEITDQLPNDLALLGVSDLLDDLNQRFPQMIWVKRIHFGGLLDAPDARGETKAQGPVRGFAVDLFTKGGSEAERLGIGKALVRGALPRKPGEILISDEFAGKLQVGPGQTVTLIGSTMHGSLAFWNFSVAGTVSFGVMGMDRGAIVVDISDARKALDMDDAAGEILGYFRKGFYNDPDARSITDVFNRDFSRGDDEFSPIMMRLKEQNDLATMMDYTQKVTGIVVAVFIVAMSIVLWNAGLLGGLRRYGEVGLRLAIGEGKGHVFRSMIYESLLIGSAGSILGTLVGLAFAYILQTKGIDVSSVMKNADMMMPSVFRAHITWEAYYIGFFPGLFPTVLGTSLAGIGIYKRETAQLFKELEV